MQRRWEKWRDHAFAKRASASAVGTEEGVAVAEPDETEEGVAATEPNETQEEEEGVLLQTATAKQKKEGKLPCWAPEVRQTPCVVAEVWWERMGHVIRRDLPACVNNINTFNGLMVKHSGEASIGLHLG